MLMITGASRGIGAATARLAGGQGTPVCVNYLSNKEAAYTVVHDIEMHGGRALALQGDMSEAADVARVFEKAATALGALTGLVNNVGILDTQMRVDEMTPERLNRLFKVNAVGAFLCAGEAVRRMSTRYGGQGGAIVNVSSGASRLGAPGEYVDYAASKGAMDTMTIGLSKEVAEEGIRVNCVRPGFIYTDIHASGGEPDRVDRVKVLVPMKRGGQPEEVARCILWLLSEQASYTTGAFVEVTGGR